MSGGHYLSKCKKKIIQIKELCLLFSPKPWHDVKPSFLFSARRVSTNFFPPTNHRLGYWATGDYLWMVWIRFVVKGSLCKAEALSPVLQVDKLLKMQNCCTIHCCREMLYTLQGDFTLPPCAVYYDSLLCPIIDRDWWWVHVSVHVSFSLGNQGYE